jgi:hypothetical protein
MTGDADAHADDEGSSLCAGLEASEDDDDEAEGQINPFIDAVKLLVSFLGGERIGQDKMEGNRCS